MRAFHSEQTIRKKVQKNKDQTCNELQLIFLGSEKQPLFECKCECNFECNCRFSWFSEILSYCQKPLKNKASIELDQKSQNFLKNLHKISKKSLYKFLFFLSKIRHFIILTKSKNTFPPNSHIYNVKNPNGEYISVTKNLLFFKWRKLYGNTRNMERYSRI